MITFPLTFQEAYWPLWNPENVSVSSTVFVRASRIAIVSVREELSQSSKYSEILCVLPSPIPILMLKLWPEYCVYAEANPVDAPLCSARTSVVCPTQV